MVGEGIHQLILMRIFSGCAIHDFCGVCFASVTSGDIMWNTVQRYKPEFPSHRGNTHLETEYPMQQ